MFGCCLLCCSPQAVVAVAIVVSASMVVRILHAWNTSPPNDPCATTHARSDVSTSMLCACDVHVASLSDGPHPDEQNDIPAMGGGGGEVGNDVARVLATVEENT